VLSVLSIAEAGERIIAEMEKELTSPITTLAPRRSILPKRLLHSRLEINETCSTDATAINNEITLKAVCNLFCGWQGPKRGEQDVVSK
jgi:hypothetical protein